MYVEVENIVILVGRSSIGVGVLGAITQRNIKRFIAYSGISHVGYMLRGRGTGSTAGIQGVWMYRMVYIRMGVVMFSKVTMMSKKGRKEKRK